MALNLAGYATFASPNPVIVQARRAIRCAMWGNDHFGVATPLHHDRNEIPEGTAPGLAWVQRTFNLEPQWTVEPDPQVIEQTIQSLLPSSTVQVTFLTEGALNKLYDVKIDNEVFVMRVSLPVDPYYKTMGEVSAVDWISRTANIPVPE